MITFRSPKRTFARAWRCSSQSSAICSSRRACSAAKRASWPCDSSRMTRSRLSERASISCLISFRVRMSGKTLAGFPVFLRISGAGESPARPERSAHLEHPDREHPEEEAADVGRKGDAAAGVRVGHREASLPELEDEPEAEEEHGGDR